MPGTYKRLYSFGSSPDGNGPWNLESAFGMLYGMTLGGGTSGYGTVFSITTAGAESVLHSFEGPPDGGSPFSSGLIHIGRVLYGVTAFGGTSPCGPNGCGTFFSVTTGGHESVLYSFSGSSFGVPLGDLADVGGTLYGTTLGDSGCGTVFDVTTSGQLNFLYTFNGGSDGCNSYAGLRYLDGKLYGTTGDGGGSACGGGGCGTVFEVTTSGQERILHRFEGGSDGIDPQAALAVVGGALYGTTYYGGLPRNTCENGSCGTVFKVTTSGKERIIYRFKGGSDGSGPLAGLIDVDGTLYGTTQSGGTGCGNDGCGTVFKLTTTGEESVLYRFKGGSDGANPEAGLTDVGGTLYGTTWEGGTNNTGTVFSIQP